MSIKSRPIFYSRPMSTKSRPMSIKSHPIFRKSRLKLDTVGSFQQEKERFNN